MNFAHFCEFWCFSLGKQARFTSNFCSGMPPGKVHELAFLWFGFAGAPSSFFRDFLEPPGLEGPGRLFRDFCGPGDSFSQANGTPRIVFRNTTILLRRMTIKLVSDGSCALTITIKKHTLKALGIENIVLGLLRKQKIGMKNVGLKSVN